MNFKQVVRNFNIRLSSAASAAAATTTTTAAATATTTTTTGLIKELRAKTGAPVKDCKNALEANKGNVEAAIVWLEKAGLLAASKKSQRETGRGVVSLFVNPQRSLFGFLQLECETDFVARNDAFRSLNASIGSAIAKNFSQQQQNQVLKLSVEEINKISCGNNTTVSETLAQSVLKLGENIRIGRCELIFENKNANERIIPYVYAPTVQQQDVTVGSVAVLMKFSGLDSSSSSSSSNATFEKLGKKIGMQLVGMNNQSIDGLLQEEFITVEEGTNAKVGEEMKRVAQAINQPNFKLDSFLRCGILDNGERYN